MNKRERIEAALAGRSVDRVPFCLWRHFYLQDRSAKDLSRATLDFYRRYGMDLIVLAPGPFFVAEGWGLDLRSFSTDDVEPYLVAPRIAQATEWRHLSDLDLAQSSLQREIEAVRLTRAGLGEDDVPLVVRIPSPLATADQLCHGRIRDDIRSFSNDVRLALEAIADVTARFALACLDAGADGYLFVTPFASRERMRSREFRDFGLGYDLQVLKRLRAATVRILQFEVEHPVMDLVSRYPTYAVCWETWRADPSMSTAREQLRGALMGGLNPLCFSDGSSDDVRSQLADAIEQTGGWKLIASPTGPVPANSRPEILSSVAQVLEDLRPGA